MNYESTIHHEYHRQRRLIRWDSCILALFSFIRGTFIKTARNRRLKRCLTVLHYRERSGSCIGQSGSRLRDYLALGKKGKKRGGNSKTRTPRGHEVRALLIFDYRYPFSRKKLRLRGNKATAGPFETSIENRAALSRRFARARDALAPSTAK